MTSSSANAEVRKAGIFEDCDLGCVPGSRKFSKLDQMRRRRGLPGSEMKDAISDTQMT